MTGIHRQSGTVWLVTGGMWSVGDVDRFRTIQQRIHATARANTGQLKLLVDLRWAAVVPQSTSARMAEVVPDLYDDRDRIAVVAGSALMKMQLRRSFHIGTSEVFETPEEALAWLDA